MWEDLGQSKAPLHQTHSQLNNVTQSRKQNNTQKFQKNTYTHFHLCVQPVFERIFILVRIEYRILFASAKLSESNSKYYRAVKYIRIIFE